MIIVSGWLRVAPDQRQAYLDGCCSVVAAARAAVGCHDFHLSADPIEADRINVYERWASVADVEAFRGSGPDDGTRAEILDADVVQYEVVAGEPL